MEEPNMQFPTVTSSNLLHKMLIADCLFGLVMSRFH